MIKLRKLYMNRAKLEIRLEKLNAQIDKLEEITRKKIKIKKYTNHYVLTTGARTARLNRDKRSGIYTMILDSGKKIDGVFFNVKTACYYFAANFAH